MEEKFSESLLDAVKRDDKKAFDSLMAQQPCGTFRLGRFPTLSLIYLYNASKIRAAYEEKFVKYNSWQEIFEPVSIAADFRKVAGKSLRFYLQEVVSPVEMLLLLDKTSKLKRVFPQTHMSQPVKQRLKTVYELKYAQKLEFRGDELVMGSRPLTRAEKKRLLLALTCFLLCVVIAVSTPFVVNAFVPFIKDGSGAIPLSNFSKTDFTSNKSYALKNDVVLEEDFFVQDVTCQLDGRGKTVTVLGKNCPFGAISGKISNVTFVVQTPLAQEVALTGVVEDVLVNVTTNATVTENLAFVAVNNFGQIKNCEVNLSGTLGVAANSDEVLEEGIVCAGIAVHNKATQISAFQTRYAVIQKCTVNFNNFTLQGEVAANATFAGIAGNNDGFVDQCQTNGKILSDTMDVSGICANNSYGIINSQNNAEIFQASAFVDWNPLACGIVLNNYYAVENCQNNGKISVQSTSEKTDFGTNEPSAVASGIAYLNNGKGVTPHLLNCKNTADVSAVAENRGVSAAGICTSSSGVTEKCFNTGNIGAQTSSEFSSYSAGLVNYAYGYVYQSASNANITANGKGNVYVGGIASVSYVQILQCATDGRIAASGRSCAVGGVLGFSNALISAENVYFGTVEACVSRCELDVATPEKTTDALVGGIVGRVDEIAVLNEQTGQFSYHGGGVTDSYFTGKINNQNVCSGAIAGSCGKNIYSANTYVSNGQMFHNFDGNFAVDSCGAELALGATVTGNGNNISYGEGGNLGVTFEEMQVIEKYTYYKAVSALLP